MSVMMATVVMMMVMPMRVRLVAHWSTGTVRQAHLLVRLLAIATSEELQSMWQDTLERIEDLTNGLGTAWQSDDQR